MVEIELFYTLQKLEVSYWREVDRNYGRNAHLQYVADGRFWIGEQKFEGRDQIRGFYAWREERGERTARHVATNLLLNADEPERPVLHSVMFLHADDGLPILTSNPAILVGDVATTFSKSGDGCWQVEAREINPIFMGGVAPTLPGPASNATE